MSATEVVAVPGSPEDGSDDTVTHEGILELNNERWGVGHENCHTNTRCHDDRSETRAAYSVGSAIEAEFPAGARQFSQTRLSLVRSRQSSFGQRTGRLCSVLSYAGLLLFRRCLWNNRGNWLGGHLGLPNGCRGWHHR